MKGEEGRYLVSGARYTVDICFSKEPYSKYEVSDRVPCTEEFTPLKDP